MARGREPAHIRSDLGQQRLGGSTPDPRDRHQPRDRGLEQREPPFDLRAHLLDVPVEFADVVGITPRVNR